MSSLDVPGASPAPTQSKGWDKIHDWVFVLYVVSLATTMSGMEIFSSLLWLCVGYDLYRGRYRFRPPTFWKPLLAFVLVAAIGIALGPAKIAEKGYDLGRMRFFGTYCVLYLELAFRYRDPNRWLRPLFFTCCVVGVYGFVQHFIPLDLVHPAGKKIILYAIPEAKVGPLVLGFFNHHLTFSNVFTFYACLFTSLGLFVRRDRPWVVMLGLFLFLLLVWTDSRAAWVAIPVMVLCVASGQGAKIGAGFFLLSLAVMSILFWTDAGFHQRFERTFLKHDDFYNLGPRRRLWRAQVKIFEERPIFGIGYNNNERFSKVYVDGLYPNRTDNFYGHAHSVPLQILASTGLMGVICYLWLWIVIFCRLFEQLTHLSRSRREYWIALGCFAAFVGFHIQGLTQWNFGDAKVLHNLMFFWAVISVIPTRETNLPVVGE